MRKLARIETIVSVSPIAQAEAIEVSHVAGWAVVTKKGEFKAGDRALYIEIDAFLPDGQPAWQFLVDRVAHDWQGQRGHILRTVRLRGQISQGLLLPLSAIDPQLAAAPAGEDLAQRLGIRKWERDIPPDMVGRMRGAFPSRVSKTEQERAQNLPEQLALWAGQQRVWEISEKLEGQSCTFAWLEDGLHVCSKSVDFLETPDNLFWQFARSLRIEEQLREHFGGRLLAIQGELVGPGIEGNIYRFKEHRFYVFGVYDVRTGLKVSPDERSRILQMLQLPGVPILGSLTLPVQDTLEHLLGLAQARSAIADVEREGIVLNSLDGADSFKAISNRYLLKQK